MCNQSANTIKMVASTIEQEIKVGHYQYFDVLETASEQVPATKLADHIAPLLAGWGTDYWADTADYLEAVVEAARLVCKPTLDATRQLQADLLAGKFTLSDEIDP